MKIVYFIRDRSTNRAWSGMSFVSSIDMVRTYRYYRTASADADKLAKKFGIDREYLAVEELVVSMI